ncbi:MAG: hypothetical protein ACRDRJ_05050 [Streptosporangiaceae bacterium]
MDISPAELEAQKRLSETGLSAAELLALPMSAYGKLTGRQLHLQPEPDDVPANPRPAAPPIVAEPVQTPGIDFAGMSLDEYAAMRRELGVGQSHKEGRGIFDSVSSQSAEYRNAARVQAGRTGWSVSNVVESPRINRVFLDQDEHRDTRTAAERLSNPSNMWQG